MINSNEYRDLIDPMLEAEIGPIWVDLDIYGTFFGSIAGLDEADQAVF